MGLNADSRSKGNLNSSDSGRVASGYKLNMVLSSDMHLRKA